MECDGGLEWEDPTEGSGGSWEMCRGDPAQHLPPAADEDDDLDDFFPEDEPVRSVFPESWFWKTITLPKTTLG